MEPKAEQSRVLQLARVQVTVQQWPLRPGWKLAAQIIAMFPEEQQKIELETLLSETNLEFAIQIMAHGIEAETFEKAKEIVESIGITDCAQLLEAVLRHNLGFLLDRLNQLKIESGPATTRR